MNFLRELWMLFVSAVLSWFEVLDNDTLNKVVNLLTIFILSVGFIDWVFRRATRKNREKQKERQEKDERKDFLTTVESTQKPFKAVKMLEDPMAPGETLGNVLEQTTIILGGKKMKKVFKWIWYNKEQLLSIAYQVVLLALANIVLFTDTFNALITFYLGVPLPLWVKIVAVVLALVLTALSVRNVVVKYGLSSLDTIDAVLKEKAEAKANKLSPEQKKIYKGYISALTDTLSKAKKDLQVVEQEFTKLTVLYNADNSLVADYTTKTLTYQKKIASDKENIVNLETKIAHFKALLSGQTVSK